MWHLISAILALGVAAGIYLFRLLSKTRGEFNGLPQPEGHHLLFGHLQIAGYCQGQFPGNVHQQNWIHFIRKQYGMGDFFYLDWWPLGPKWLFICDPELASKYITTGQSLPKSSLESNFVIQFLGDQNMVSLEGNQWKTVRSIFNPGFSASHLMTLVPYIVDATIIFCNVIRMKALSGELFELEEYATRMTIDIIGKVVCDSDFDSQKGIHPIVDAFRERAVLMPSEPSVLPWANFDPARSLKLWLNGRKLDRLIGRELDKKLEQRTEGQTGSAKSSKDKKRSVVDLALDAYQKEQVDQGEMKQSGARSSMDARFRQIAIDSMKTFIFAGHDTTASTIAYTFYLLHFHPKVHQKIVAELGEVFGAGSTSETMAEAIKNDPHVINRLEYITAVIKETLRLFPPASTLRYHPPQSDPDKTLFLTDRSGKQYPISGFHVWPVSHMIGRNEDFFPEPVKFVPERFIPSQTPFPDSKLFTPAGKDAWRPFEKGPRNCVGQELAMVEMRITTALLVKDFDFVAEYDGKKCESWTPIETVDEFRDGLNGAKRKTVEGHRVYQILKGAAKPAGGMPGRMHIRSTKKGPKSL